MMKLKRILSLLLTLSLLMGICVCGTASAAGPADPAGGYLLTGVTGGEGSDLEIISRAVELGARFYLFLEEDGSGFMRFMEAEIPLSWDENGITIAPQRKLTKNITLPCAYDAGAVSIRTPVYTMDFRAMTAAELRDSEVNGPGSLGGILGGIVQGLLGKLGSSPVDSLLSVLALGSTLFDKEVPIPDGAVTAGTVSGTVNGLDYVILGADHVQDPEAGDLIVFYFDVTNNTDESRTLWIETFDASQGGAFLEPVFGAEAVPEAFNVNYDFVPGRTIRAAAMFQFDPAGGKVSFRISSYYDQGSTLCYYADPKALSGAPETPFRFDDDPSLPEMFLDLPEGTENVSFGGVEFFNYQDEYSAMRFFIRCPNDSEDDANYLYHFWDAYQDGVSLTGIWDDPDTVDSEEDHIRAGAVRLRTGSPVIIVVYEETNTDIDIVAAKVFEVG